MYTDVIDMCLATCPRLYPDLDGHAVCTGQIAAAPKSMQQLGLIATTVIAVCVAIITVYV